jgi:hypothetical protein
MSPAPSREGLTLAIHPSTRGFGWVAFEGPFTPFDWGLVFARKDKNAVCLRRLEAMLGQFLPHTLVLEEFERRTSSRADRIAKLCRAVVSLAADRGVEVAIYAKGEVQACFANGDRGAAVRRAVLYKAIERKERLSSSIGSLHTRKHQMHTKDHQATRYKCIAAFSAAPSCT